jgi:hypothetical protein
VELGKNNKKTFSPLPVRSASWRFPKHRKPVLKSVSDHSQGAAPAYGARQIKRRRSTKAEIEQRRENLYTIVEAGRPMTVRQVFNQAAVRRIVEKAETGYSKVQTDLTLMRRAGELPYGWLADNSRWQRKPTTYDSVQEALEETARLYRKSLWTDADSYVEVWLEKDALAGVVYPITSRYDVPLMVARGYASLSFLHSAAEYINELDVPTYIYHLGDFDPSGVNASEKIEESLQEMAPDAEIYFERIAVTDEQIDEWNPPTRPTRNTDSRAKTFGEISVELDAIEPNQLRDLVSDIIEAITLGLFGRFQYFVFMLRQVRVITRLCRKAMKQVAS